MPADASLLKRVKEEVLAGLPHEKPRLDDARLNLACYRAKWDLLQTKLDRDGYEKIPHRHSLIMQRVVNVLTKNLYKEGPKRTLPDHPEAGDWLEAVYRANWLDAMFQQADRLATVGDAAMFQVTADPDPDNPLRVRLWDASQFVVWVDPEDQLAPAVVGVTDVYNEQRRIRVWTEETVSTYMTEPIKGVGNQTAGGTEYRFRGEKAHNYGVLPFSFVHFSQSFTDFMVDGIGTPLRQANENGNLLLTQIGGCVRFNLVPILKAKNTPVGWTMPRPIRPGDVVHLDGTSSRSDGEGAADADLEYLQSDPGFVAASWDDLEAYFNHTVEMAGVPKAAVRMEQDSARSGVSIVAEQIPLIDWAEGRQRQFAYHEDGLCRLILRVGAQHLGAQEYEGYRVAAGALGEAVADPGLVLRWPRMFPNLPGPERDATDLFALENSMASRTTIIMKNQGLTREEARSYLDDVAEDLRYEHELIGPVEEVKTQQEADKAKAMTEATTPPEPGPDGPDQTGD